MIGKLLLLVAALSICWLAVPQTAAAFDPFGGVSCSGDNANSAVCTDKSKGASDPVSGKNGVLQKATNIMAGIAGIAAVILILIGSINYLTANGDPAKISSAKNTIIYTLVGLAVIVLVRAIILFVMQKLS